MVLTLRNNAYQWRLGKIDRDIL